MRILLPLALAAVSAAARAGSIVVNEVQTAGLASGSDEFVEIANVSSSPVDLNAWKVVYRSAAGASDTLLCQFSAGTVLAAGAVMVLGGTEYTGPRDRAMAGALSTMGGSVAVRDAAGARVDSVAWGDTTANAFVEGHPAIAPEAGHSIHRIPCGRDTDENRSDFQDLFPPTPKVPCAGTAPIVERASFSPPTVDPGGIATLSATVTPHGADVAGVTADLSSLGGSAAAAMSPAGLTAWTLSVAVPTSAVPGDRVIPVRATDAAGAYTTGVAALTVNNLVPGRVVIHEVQTAGATPDAEFVEIYNRTGAEVDVAGWTLVYRAATGTKDTVLCTLGPLTIRAGRTLLLATDDYTAAKDADMDAGLGASGGSLALKDLAGLVADSVGYGNADNAFVEGAPAPAPEAGQSIERTPAGQDTNNNAADFRVRTSPTPSPATTQPAVAAVSFAPDAVDPGGQTALTAIVIAGGSPIASVVADLTSVGFAYEEPLAPGPGGTWTKSLAVSSYTTPGIKTVAVTAKGGDGLTARRSGVLMVNAPAPPPVKVNEVKTGGPASSADEFVEIANPARADADLYGWKLVYRGATSSTDSTLYAFGPVTLRAGGRMVFGGSAFTGGKDGALSGSLTASGGSVGLRDPYGRLVDSVGYGTAANSFVEGAPALAPAAGQSIERSPAGADSGDNAADFVVRSAPTPTALSACPSVASVAFAPNPVAPGGAFTLTASTAAGASPIGSVAADLSAIGGPASVSLTAGTGGAWSVAAAVSASAALGARTVPVTATDTAGLWTCGWGVLTVASGNLRGDANGDGAVDIRDAAVALKLAGGLLPGTSSGVRPANADVWPPSADGHITLADALRLARAALSGGGL